MSQEIFTDFTIGALAREAGCSVQSVRWYEAQGLLPAAARTAGNQRRYEGRHLARLKFLRHARDLGFSLDDIRELLSLTGKPDMTCEAADVIASRHLARLKFLRHARDLGFSLDDIRELLSLTGKPDMTCEVADSIASRHLARVEERIAALTELRDELSSMVHECRGGRIADCKVIEVLSDHQKCQHDEHLDVVPGKGIA